ncbi:MAG: hypothetical protein ACO1O1_12900 [Adhaeribacter sp.]
MQAYSFLWAAALLLSQAALGQSFTYRARLGPVPADSFYQVPLPPAITRHLQPGYADLRLFDENKRREVPYLLVPRRQEPRRYHLVAHLPFRQEGSLRQQKTILRFQADTAVLLDQLRFHIAAPGLYHRPATLYRRRETRRKHRRDYEFVAHFVLAARQANTLELPGFRSRDFYVEITNGDNPPLAFSKVGAYQQTRSLVAALEAGRPYYLAFGSPRRLPRPAYDLSYFQDLIPPQLPTLRAQQVQTIPLPAPAGRHLNALFTSRHLIWAALLAVIALLAFMSYRLVKETGKNR